MYRVLVADDELPARKYLAGRIQELCPDFQVTGVAADGMEAIRLCGRQRFDLVITDIRMPELDGLGVCKFLAESGADTRMVILSGYSEFEYARSAIRYQVSDYILKPINDENLKKILWSMKEELDGRERSGQGEDDAPEGRGSYELACELFGNIINDNEGRIYPLFSVLEDRGYQCLEGQGCVALLMIDELELLLRDKNNYDLNSYHLKLFKLCRDYCGERELIVACDSRQAVQILVQAPDRAGIEEKLKDLYRELSGLARAEGVGRLLMAGGSFFTDIMEAGDSGLTAYEASALCLKNRRSPVTYGDYEREKEFLTSLEDICGQIYLTYLRSDEQPLDRQLADFWEALPKEGSAAALLRRGAYLIHYVCDRSSAKAHYVRSACEALTGGADELLRTDDFSREAACGVLKRALTALFVREKPVRASESSRLVESARQYIYSHFSEPVSLTALADELGVNGSYLSDLFHRSTGESYSRFLLRVRMERAAELIRLSPGERIYVIAGRVGFVSAKHFITAFKKYYGVTPSVYAEQGRT